MSLCFVLVIIRIIFPYKFPEKSKNESDIEIKYEKKKCFICFVQNLIPKENKNYKKTTKNGQREGQSKIID